jgi:SAM-dependent methyltransferase
MPDYCTRFFSAILGPATPGSLVLEPLPTHSSDDTITQGHELFQPKPGKKQLVDFILLGYRMTVKPRETMSNSTKNTYNPSVYWESRLSSRFNLTGVGYRSLGTAYNEKLYKARVRALERGLNYLNRPIDANTSVMEIGCGTGFFTGYCANRGVTTYTGVDITAVSVQNLSRIFPHFNFIQADITQDTFSVPASFDIVLIADVLYHIVDDTGFERALYNISQTLKPGGLLIISDVFPSSTVQIAPHVRLRSFATYQQILGRHGISHNRLELIFAALHPPLEMPTSSFGYRLYAKAWRPILYLLAWKPLELFLSAFLDWLDQRYLLKRFGERANTVKWLFASDTHAD